MAIHSVSGKKLFSIILLALLTAGAALFSLRSGREPFITGDSPSASERASREIAARVARLEAREQNMAETTWAKEILAQQCGRTFESLWDSINAASNKLHVAADFPIGAVVLARWPPPQMLPHGIEVREPAGAGQVLAPGDWRRLIEEFERAGWRLAQTEFRHNRFETDSAGQAHQSQFYFSAHLANSVHGDRAILEGTLVVDWGKRPPGTDAGPVKRIDASQLSLKTRTGETPFHLILDEQIAAGDKTHLVDTLITYDLDGDGLSEIILPSKNVLYRFRGGNRYEAEPLRRTASGMILAGLIADFDGDGAADLLSEQFEEGLVLFRASAGGAFDQPGRKVWRPPTSLKNTMVLTCGDIDRDGDLDVFLGQYKVPTLGQILRPRYFDANDGHPSYLLLNDGKGMFTDATAMAGLENKRLRRIFSASFVDLDADGDLDLLVVSDFAGIDVYRNNGRGQFTDVTGEWVTNPHGFGMAHALADFNHDGRPDFLMIGMNSPTVDRLEHLGLTRSLLPEDRAMRRAMTFGNRLYLARSNSGFEQTPLNNSIARAGWSWGCSAFDFDNDGFTDAYIANGHETKQTVHDYESEFWLHDLFVDETVDDVTATVYFTAKFSRTRGRGWSYGGYEKNRLLWNQRAGSFIEIAHLMGVALEQDSRSVVADDLDGDGRVDLLVTTLEVWPEAKQTLRVYRNVLNDTGNWIGFRFREEKTSPAGVRVTIHYDGRSTVRHMVNGDSFRAQHSNGLHFGLGSAKRVDRAEIRWPSGQATTLREPALNRYHSISFREENETTNGHE